MDPAKAPELSAELAKRAALGDRLAFSELLDREYDFIFRVAYRWLGNQEQAEDLTQDLCIKLARTVGQFEGRSRFRTWLYRLVLNAARDQHRSAGRSPNTVDIGETEVADPRSADADLEREALWQAVRQLPPRQADSVLLVYAEEKSHAEAAAILGCSESTVSWHVHEAKKALRALL
ncbi:MAG: RNA polymerase sigma factor [Hyphomicrobiaceae bacterium]|nr:RNA polymerase sigma factor [Hyphomicrobiaceae bacterium]